MALTNEDLLAISNLLDSKLKPINDRLTKMEVLQENEILPRLQNIEACYTSTYRRYASGIEEMKSLQADMEILKKVVEEHSKKLQRLA
jgi:hypothetical protein